MMQVLIQRRLFSLKMSSLFYLKRRDLKYENSLLNTKRDNVQNSVGV